MPPASALASALLVSGLGATQCIVDGLRQKIPTAAHVLMHVRHFITHREIESTVSCNDSTMQHCKCRHTVCWPGYFIATVSRTLLVVGHTRCLGFCLRPEDMKYVTALLNRLPAGQLAGFSMQWQQNACNATDCRWCCSKPSGCPVMQAAVRSVWSHLHSRCGSGLRAA